MNKPETTPPTYFHHLRDGTRLFASTFPDWTAFSRAYAALFAPKAVVTLRIQAVADEVTADRREQAQRLYEWVGQHVRWVAFCPGNGSFLPHAADSTLADGSQTKAARSSRISSRSPIICRMSTHS